MRMHRRAALAAIALLSAISLAACGGSSPTDSTAGASDGAASGISGEITVFAAASLQKAYEDISTAFKEANPDASVNFDFQGSQDLVSNLAEGSTADVLATADTENMDKAVSQGLVDEPRDFATNVLSIIVPEGNPAGITGFDESLNAEGVTLAICDPDAHVPCGNATKKMEEATGITLSDPASKETKVTDVKGKVESGEANAGIVYATDAATSKGTEEIKIPDHGVVNHYPIATTANPSNAEGAKAFVDFVLSDKGQEILAEYGFGAPGGASAAPSGSATTAGPAAPSSMPAETSKASEAASPGETGKPDEASNKPDTETATP